MKVNETERVQTKRNVTSGGQNTSAEKSQTSILPGRKANPKEIDNKTEQFQKDSETRVREITTPKDKGEQTDKNKFAANYSEAGVWERDRNDDGTNITRTSEAEAKQRQTELEKKGRWGKYRIVSSDDKKTWWVEVANPQRIFRVAWTIDDGPQGTNTEAMKTEGLGGLKNVTWYVQRDRIDGKDAEFKKLKALQDGGGEIAIHSFHPSVDHSTWFPVSGSALTEKQKKVYGTPYAGQTEDVIMGDLTSFYKELSNYGIKVKFVRLPGGLTSELSLYAKTLGVQDAETIKTIKKKILANEDVSHDGTAAIQIQKDFQTIKKKLAELDLLEWSGTVDPLAIEGQSWQSETSGQAGRADSTTKKTSKGAQGTTLPGDAGIFENKLNELEAQNRVSGSLVILTHDNSTADASAVAEDKKEMERLADIRGVTIEYHTMSSLFGKVTGKDASNYDVQY
jgi:hypothetical protein